MGSFRNKLETIVNKLVYFKICTLVCHVLQNLACHVIWLPTKFQKKFWHSLFLTLSVQSQFWWKLFKLPWNVTTTRKFNHLSCFCNEVKFMLLSAVCRHSTHWRTLFNKAVFKVYNTCLFCTEHGWTTIIF